MKSQINLYYTYLVHKYIIWFTVSYDSNLLKLRSNKLFNIFNNKQ